MTTYYFPRLYKVDKLGRNTYWNIYVIDDQYFRESQIGENGKIRKFDPVKVIPKNVGRSNETTSHEQAILKAKSEWSHKKDRQVYRLVNIECSKDGEVSLIKDTSIVQIINNDVNVKDKDGKDEEEGLVIDITTLRPMLAEKFNERKHKIKYPAYASPKLDGVRCMSFLLPLADQKTKVVLASRTGKEFDNMNGLREQIETLLLHTSCPYRVVLDGEIYSHDVPLNIISGVARGKSKNLKYDNIMEYHIFDIYVPDKPLMPFRERYEFLESVFKKYNFTRLRFVNSTIINSEEQVFKYHDKFVADGYEGAIIRNLEGVYGIGRKVNDLQKYKEFVDKEFLIIDVIDGVGSEKDAAIYVCKFDDTRTFTVRPRGSIESRREAFLNKKDYIGKNLTVRYQEDLKNMDRVPQFPIGIVVRDYE